MGNSNENIFKYFSKVKFVLKQFPGMHVIYRQHVGDYKKIQGFFMYLGTTFKGHFSIENMGFVIHFDDPSNLVQPEKARCIGGIILTDEEVDSDKTRQFLKNNPNFHYTYIKKCPSLFTFFPYLNYVSC